MKAQSERPDISEMPPYRLGRHWNTIQAYLIPGIEDDIGELNEEPRKFMEICELLIDDKMFAKYRWCGNGRPPTIRRLCGGESVADIPDKSQFSRTFKAFAIRFSAKRLSRIYFMIS